MSFRIDPQRSRLGFSVKHMMISTVRGSFSKFDVDLEINEQDLTASRAHARVATRSVETGDRLRDDYLRGKDFFNPDVFPEMHFKSERVQLRGARLTLDGTLTIRDRTRALSLAGTFGQKERGTSRERWIFELSGDLDREAYGLVFNGAVETVSVVVGKKVKLDLHIEFERAETNP